MKKDKTVKPKAPKSMPLRGARTLKTKTKKMKSGY